jgi:hypothetical protein
MLIAFKALGATCLAGALAASGVLTSDFAGHRQTEGPTTTTLVSDPHATFETLAVGEQKAVSADEAGSATVARTDAGLEVAAVAPAAGWTAATKTLAPDWLLITFASPSRQIDLSLDIAGDNLRIRKAALDVGVPTTTEAPTTTEPPTTTTTTEPPTTTTTTPPPPTVVTLPPPVQPTVIPVAGAGTVVIVLQGPVVIVREVKALPGWIASVERRAGDVDVLFRNGDRSFRFFASMADRRMTSAIREVRADGDHPVGFDDHHDGGHRGKG